MKRPPFVAVWITVYEDGLPKGPSWPDGAISQFGSRPPGGARIESPPTKSGAGRGRSGAGPGPGRGGVTVVTRRRQIDAGDAPPGKGRPVGIGRERRAPLKQ